MDTLNVASANLYSRPSGLLYTTHFHTLPQGTEIQCVLVQQEPDRHSTRAPLTIVGCQIQPLGSLQGVSLFTRHVTILAKSQAIAQQRQHIPVLHRTHGKARETVT